MDIQQGNYNPNISNLAGLGIPPYDYIGFTTTGSQLTAMAFKNGGSSGTTVATLSLAYSGSTLTSITKT